MTESSTAEIDSQYRRFPSFQLWRTLSVDEASWSEARDTLKARKDATTPIAFRAALDRAMRAAAVSTGAIENLYEADRGFTITVMEQAATWHATVNRERGRDVTELIEAQLSGYDQALDIATGAQPISEAWIRNLHQVVCAPQKTYKADTPSGVQEREFPKGVYKSLPNHVIQPDGSIHAYAPVLETPIEMQRLAAEIATPEFIDAHPCLQSSYLHYAFVAIHPFADGNGRVARALASIHLLKAVSVPLVLFSDQKTRYFVSLARADGDNHQAFVDFLAAKALDSIWLVSEKLRVAAAPASTEVARALDDLYVTPSGHTHAQVDDAGRRLLQALEASFRSLIGALGAKFLTVQAVITNGAYATDDASLRMPIQDGVRICRLVFQSQAPADVNRAVDIGLFLSKATVTRPVAVLQVGGQNERFAVPIDDLVPELSTSVQFRLEAWSEALFGIEADRVRRQAAEKLRTAGY